MLAVLLNVKRTRTVVELLTELCVLPVVDGLTGRRWTSMIARWHTVDSWYDGSSSSWWPDRKEMDNHDCTLTHSGLLIWWRAASCSVVTSHTSLHRCLTSPNETGSPDTTTRWWPPARRSRKSRMRSEDACRLQCCRQWISLLYSNTTISLAVDKKNCEHYLL